MKRAFLGLWLMVMVAIGACKTSLMTPQDEANIATYSAQQSACVVAHQPDKAAIDACRAQVRSAWNARWAVQFSDAGASASDAGGQ